MKYKFNKNKGKLYIQLYEQIKKDIVEGVYKYNQKLDSKRILAQETNLSIITIEHALNLLIDEGYIINKERSGYFVIYKKEDFYINNEIIKEKQVSSKTIKSNITFPYSVLSKAIRKVIINHKNELFNKSDSQGIYELRSEISKYLFKTIGIKINPKQIFIGAGSEYLYGLLALFFNNKKNVIIENPSYEKIEKVYKLYNFKCIKLDLFNNGINSTTLKNTNADLLHVTPFNSYPSGISIDINKKHTYLNWAKKNNAFIIEDNYDSELTISKRFEEPLILLSDKENVIYLNTFSNTITPSLRIAYMILPNKLIKDFNNKLGFYSCSVPVFEQYILYELINSGEYEKHINRVRRKKRRELETN